MLDLEKLEQIYSEAQEGTWHPVGPPWVKDGDPTWVIAGSFDPHLGTPVCDAIEIFEWPAEDDRPDYSQSDANMRAIVALHNAFPLMVREIRHLRAMVAGMRREATET